MTSANGHVPRACQRITVPLSGPVSAWEPPGPDTLGHGRPTADTASRWPADGDTAIRALAAAVVLAVAAFAAIVSYSHIFELGRHNGQDGTAARLLPLSVDGLIAAASLVMLHAARRELDVPRLARWMLGLGVGATVAANVEYGMPFGWVGAVISAWPAVAFVGSVEMAVRFVRDSRTAAASSGVADDGMMTSPRHDIAAAPDVAGQPGKNGGEGTGLVGSSSVAVPAVATSSPAGDATRPAPQRRRKARSGSDRARDILRRHPDADPAEVARRAGVGLRQVQRVISDMKGTAP